MSGEINDDAFMTQDERRLAQWKEVMDFMETNKRRPSKFVDEERGMRNWWKHQQKLVNAGQHYKPYTFNDVVHGRVVNYDTLCTYIRNCIDHPDPNVNPSPTQDEMLD